MKAYTAYEENEGYAVIVFAETAGKARALVMCTDEFEGYSFPEINVRRRPEADQYYRGEWRMDWEDDQDRRGLLALGFYCSNEADYDDCMKCADYKFCQYGQDLVQEYNDDNYRNI